MTRFFPVLMLPLTLAACTQSPSSAGDLSQASSSGTSDTKTASDEGRLGGYLWQLEDATDMQGHRIDVLLVRPDMPIRFDFAGDRIAVHNACNGIGGDLRIDGDTLRIGALISTKMACADPAVMALDGEIGKRLQGTSRFELLGSDPPQLRWTAETGDVLRFVGTPKAETRFGGPGETLFMEVAARMKPCERPTASSSQSCLEVRELRYDAEGLPSGKPGEWRLFHEAIEGYTHQDGIRNVLRLKRFPIDNPPKNAPATTYVLEMVIESEMVEP